MTLGPCEGIDARGATKSTRSGVDVEPAAIQLRSCTSARELAALAPDHELSFPELRQLEAHLTYCRACADFASHVATITTLLRDAGLAPRALAELVEQPAGCVADLQPPTPPDVPSVRRPTLYGDQDVVFDPE